MRELSTDSKRHLETVLLVIVSSFLLCACGRSDSASVQPRNSGAANTVGPTASVPEQASTGSTAANVNPAPGSGSAPASTALSTAMDPLLQVWQSQSAQTLAQQDKELAAKERMNQEDHASEFKLKQLDVLGGVFTTAIMVDGMKSAMPGARNCGQKSDSVHDILNQAQKSINGLDSKPKKGNATQLLPLNSQPSSTSI